MFDVPVFRPGFGIVLVLLAGLASASAQSNRVPGPTDYTAFARYITDRNIFDPMRYGPVNRPMINVRRSDPMFTLVGTMSYGKGMFAFFDGNNSELRQALAVSGSIAGYTVTEITLSGATLQGAHTNQVIALKVGDSMRQVAGAWQFAGQSELTGGAGDRQSRGQTESAPETPVVLPTTGEQGDILKRLKQQRDQEEK
jgi:hypothetical protein